MLVNGRALLSLINNKSYDRKISERLLLLQDDHWREIFAILTANLLFIFEDEHHLSSPIVMIIIEDCTVEPADDNQTGMPYSFVLKSKTTKRVFTFCTDNFKSLEQWIHYLTVCSLEYIQAMLSSSTDQPKLEDKQSTADDKADSATNSNHKT
ncbi:PH domain-containing protein [Aphelenchoides bicaudatus]|nr:PH domain-containing protein [Aphelenchoides bicaudatus]